MSNPRKLITLVPPIASFEDTRNVIDQKFKELSSYMVKMPAPSDFQGQVLSNLLDPIQPSDAATKEYVDQQILAAGGFGSGGGPTTINSTITVNTSTTTGTGGGVTPPDITSLSATVVYTQLGNDSAFQFSGTIGLPTTDPLYSALTSIHVVAIGPDAEVNGLYQAVFDAPFTGTTLDYIGPLYPQELMAHDYTIVVYLFNSNGDKFISTFTSTVHVAASAVTAIAGAEVSNWATEISGSVHVIISATISCNTYPQNVTLWKQKTGGTDIVWLGWWNIIAPTQVVSIGAQADNPNNIFAPTADESWQLVAYPGAVASTQTYPTGYLTSSSFTVHKPATPSSSLASNAYVDAITYGASQFNGRPFGWGHMYCTVDFSAAHAFAVRFTVETGHFDTSGTFVRGGDHPYDPDPNASPPHTDGWFKDYDRSVIPQGGSTTVTLDISNLNYWVVPVDGNVVHRIKVWIENVLGVWVQQNCWSSAVGVSTPGTNAYQDIVVDGAMGVPAYGNGLIPGEGALPAVLASGDNQLVNPGFENSYTTVTPWTTSGVTLLQTNGGHTQQNYLKLNPSSYVEQLIVGKPGQQFVVAIWYKSQSLSAVAANLQINAFDSSGSYISTPGNVSISVATTTWTPLLLYTTLPAGAAYASLKFGTGSNGNDVWFVDDAVIVTLTTGNTVSSGAGGVSSNNGNLSNSVVGDPSFEFSPVGLLAPGNGSVWSPSDMTSVTILDTGGNSGNRFVQLSGANSGVQQNLAVQPGQPYYISAYVKSNNPGGTPHSVSLYYVWWTSTGSVISTSSFSTSGVVSSWTLALNGFVTAPATAAMATIQVITSSSEHSGGIWYVDDINLQPVVNQTGNGQVQSTNPTAQTSGYSAVTSSSSSTSATATYGLSYADIIASDGSYVYLNAVAGQGRVKASDGSNTYIASLTATSSSASCSVNDASNTSAMFPTFFYCANQAGQTAVVPLAKLTPGGSNGSLTITGGIINGHVNPT